jgi:hypothetical protein
MSQGGGGSSKPKGMGREEIVTLARRPPRHSSLFWYLFDQHDELIEAKKQSGLGIPWESRGFCEVRGAKLRALRERTSFKPD